ncbi:MAG: hypothetical protein Q8R76_10060 [Candidatus Omnitrophota bacterium]|nr:hypothetical protein [Candidatus Omnitrophota bacterium]
MPTDTEKNLSQLTVYIEENLRAARKKGVHFVDPRHLKDRVLTRQNHIIFGRRGAGKTTLLSAITQTKKDFITIYINLEDAKDTPIADTLIRILTVALSELRRTVKEQTPWFNAGAWRLRRKIEKQKEALDKLGEKEAGEKLAALQQNIEQYKDLFRATPQMLGHKAIYLALDDFYFVPHTLQPDLLDYVHRLTKDTDLYLKVASVKDRSTLYRAEAETYRGVELGHDAHEIDIDYTMEKFAEMENFLHELLEAANQESGAAVKIDTYFKEDGFRQLCLASEGVPRNFLSLFVKIANRHKDDPFAQPFIGKDEIADETGIKITEPPVKQKSLIQRFITYIKTRLAKLSPRKPAKS